MTARSPGDAAALSAYLEGEVTASERAVIETELANSASARRTLAQLRNLSELLATPDADLEAIDLAARVRTAARQPAAARPASATRFRALWLAGLAACLSSWLFLAHRPEENVEFRSKANGTTLAEGRRWAGIEIYHLAEHGTPEALGDRMAPDEGLLFSYTNLGPHPLAYLMIFAIDGKGRVHWFYPAYESADKNPRAIAIERDRANVPLGELVQQDFSDGPLAIYGFFTPRQISVLEVEAWLRAHERPGNEGPVPGGVLQRIDTQVVR